jgi:hypothetical protein
MRQIISVLIFATALMLGASCARENPITPPTANGLIGLTKADLMAQFGDPDNADQSRPGVEGMFWGDGSMRLRAFVQDGRVISVCVPMASSLKLDSGIGYGSSLDDVIHAYGEITSTRDTQADMKTMEYSAGTLYHNETRDSYTLHYDAPPLHFILDANKKVKVFSFGKHM